MSSRSMGNVSDFYPWLLKGGKFNGSNLNDFEFGPVIGIHINKDQIDFSIYKYHCLTCTHLGKGYSGTVRVMRYKKEKYCVFKAIRKDVIQKRNDHRHIRNEKDCLLTINNPFCIKMLTTFQDKSNIYFALEYAPGGELFHRLDRKQFFPPDTAKFYASEVFVAIDHIQTCGFVYRDLKPENAMIDEEVHVYFVQ